MEMDLADKRRFFQQMKSMTLEQFWKYMTIIHSNAYSLGAKHMIEAMEMHPKIYKPTVEQVIIKANQIREEWDEVKEKEVTTDELQELRNELWRGRKKYDLG